MSGPTLAADLASLATRAVAGAGLLGSALWVAHLAHLIRHRRAVVFLADLDCPPPGPAGAPAVAVIFAARDEAAGVERATRSMLDELADDPSLRLVAVDDRSSDATGAILDRLAAGQPRAEVVHVADLPAGWLGKTNALQQGSATPGAADARWLLFTDADVIFRPGAIRRAVAFAEAEGVDLLCVAPEVDTRSAGERAFLTLFGLLFSVYTSADRVADRRSRAHVGIGAFNLVRAEAFLAIGGFRHLALSVDDDMRLGQALKYAGYSTRLLLGRGAVAVRWQSGTWGMVRGVEKNFFAGLKFRLGRAGVVLAGILVVGVGPFAGLLVGPAWTRAGSTLGIAALVVMMAAAGRQSRIAWYYALTLPAAAGLVALALVRSTALTLARGGVVWRGRLYPLTTLKAHVRERDAWLDEVWQSTR